MLSAAVLALVLAFTAYTSLNKTKPAPQFHQTALAAVQPPSPAPPAAKQAYRGLPVSLKIPAIGVDTSIEYNGLAKNGDMQATSNPNDVGWYKYGAIPGEAGSAVIAGHVVGARGEAAVFARINKLQPGDLLLVDDAKGQTASFTVREIKTYDQQAQHGDVFDSGAGTHLNIVTCAGEWDKAHHRYLDRLVVFADKSV